MSHELFSKACNSFVMQLKPQYNVLLLIRWKKDSC